MKRAPRLVELSREHHIALRLAQHLARAPEGTRVPSPASLAEIRTEAPALLAHFATEERDLLPELQGFGETALAERLLAEHAQLRALLAQNDEQVAMSELGRLLNAHVRFEERTLFPALEAHWAREGGSEASANGGTSGPN